MKGSDTRDRRVARGDYFRAYLKTRDPVKMRARQQLQYAVRTGKLFKSPWCEEIGCDETRTEGHHHDYTQALDVRWLCPAHHRAQHLKEAA